MKILVTGSCGHLGEALMRTFQKLGYNALGIDILPSQFTTQVGSIVDKAFVNEMVKDCDYIIHAATLHKPHVLTHSKQDFIDVNITGTLNLLEAAVKHQVKAFIFTSTTSTFGDAMWVEAGNPAVWVTEKLKPIPKNIYGATKTASEDLCQLFYRNYQLPCLVLKTSRFFLEIDDNKTYRDSFTDLNIKANEFLNRRVEIQDAVDAHLLAIQKAVAIGFGKYIITATTPFQRKDLSLLNENMEAVVKQYFPEMETIFLSRNWKMFPKIGRVYVNEKARRELGWQPKYDFQYVLDCVKQGKPIWSPLALEIGIKGYHPETFDDGPYPV